MLMSLYIDHKVRIIFIFPGQQCAKAGMTKPDGT